MIRFRCEHCGRKFRVPDTIAGKKAVCLKCKNIVIVPTIKDAKPIANQTDAPEISSKDSILDPNLFDIPQKTCTAPDIPAQTTYEAPSRFEPKPLPKRKLPWLVDIFLYPTSKAGLAMLGIFIGVPLCIDILSLVFNLVALQFPPFIVFTLLFLIIGLIVNIVMMFYRYWYLSECVRDSAGGQIRAPETIALTPGLELFWSFLRIFVCVIIFIAPVYNYLLNYKNIDRSFWPLFDFTLSFPWTVMAEIGKGELTFHLLLLFSVFFFPMTVLSVIMSDSLRGLNPLRIVRSIFITFAPYGGLVLLLCFLWMPVTLIRKFIVTQVVSGRTGLPLFLPRAASIYLLLIAAHLLGRFYWKYEEKLNWDV